VLSFFRQEEVRIVKYTQFFLILGILFSFSCSKPTPVPAEVVATPTPVPPDPEVDNTFLDKQAVEAWRAEFAKMVEDRAAAPSPEKILAYAKDFKVDVSKPDPLIGDPVIWNSDWAYVYPSYSQVEEPKKDKPNVEQAKALEAANRHLDAAWIWIEMGKVEDAKRCGEKLIQKGEWKAVAMVAVLTGDLGSLTQATTKMMKADQFSRTQDVVHFAFQKDKMNAAKHLCVTHGWQIEDVLLEEDIRSLARRGDASLMPALIERSLKDWENQQYNHNLDDLVADIMTFAKSNPTKAKVYATRYLKLPQANVLIWVSCGEGCYNTPIRGSLELYQLVKADASLREMYFERARQFVNEAFPLNQGDVPIEVIRTIAGDHAGNMSGWSTDMWGNTSSSHDGGNLLFTYLWHVRRSNDQHLKSFWAQMLDTFGNRKGMDGPLIFEREIGRFLLGLPSNAKAQGLTPEQSVVLDVFQGRSAPDPILVWKSLTTVSEEEAQKIPSLRWLFNFLIRGDISPVREAQIRTELSLEKAEPEESSHLRFILRYLLDQVIRDRENIDWLKDHFRNPQNALWTNMRAQTQRTERGLPAINLYPDTDQEFQEIITPSLTLLGEKLPGMLALYRQEHPAIP